MPVTPVVKGRPEQLLKRPDVGVPKRGVTSSGLVLKTNAPLPVSPVTAAAKFALEGVARKVATPVPKPLMPVPTGKPVQLVNVPDVGVPSKGVTSVGLVANTFAPEPVLVVTPVPPFATATGVASANVVPVRVRPVPAV